MNGFLVSLNRSMRARERCSARRAILDARRRMTRTATRLIEPKVARIQIRIVTQLKSAVDQTIANAKRAADKSAARFDSTGPTGGPTELATYRRTTPLSGCTWREVQRHRSDWCRRPEPSD